MKIVCDCGEVLDLIKKWIPKENEDVFCLENKTSIKILDENGLIKIECVKCEKNIHFLLTNTIAL